MRIPQVEAVAGAGGQKPAVRAEGDAGMPLRNLAPMAVQDAADRTVRDFPDPQSWRVVAAVRQAAPVLVELEETDAANPQHFALPDRVPEPGYAVPPATD